MSKQEAIRILMLSPFYFKLAPADRQKLVVEYCELVDDVKERRQSGSPDGSGKGILKN
ncbi:MAG: hypothetical protein ABFS19_10125 [Thermodesulfobacteriota bacterium]